jgi:hypothetical protein
MSIAKRLIEEELNKKSQAEIDRDELVELDEIYLSKIRSRKDEVDKDEVDKDEVDKDEVDKDEVDGAAVKIRASEMWWADACARMEDLIKSSIQRDDLSSKEKIELLAAWERIRRG